MTGGRGTFILGRENLDVGQKNNTSFVLPKIDALYRRIGEANRIDGGETESKHGRRLSPRRTGRALCSFPTPLLLNLIVIKINFYAYFIRLISAFH